MRTLILFSLIFGVLNATTAQEYLLKGRVTDTENNVLSGVSVENINTKKTTKTDNNGTFEIKVNPKDILEISFAGMKTQRVSVEGKKTIIIVLEDDNLGIEIPISEVMSEKEPVAFDMIRMRGASTIMAYDRKEEHETYKIINENNFKEVSKNPISTFSADVDKASYSNVRRIINNGYLPEKDAVRIEEMINYFDYQYPEPMANSDVPFRVSTELSNAPWNEKNYLLQIGLQAKKIKMEDTPPSNIVFLLDVSGSMHQPNKLPLLKSSFKLLLNSLKDNDKVAIVVYAGNSGLVLKSTEAKEKATILKALESLTAGGSTAGGEGLKLAYKVARENFIPNGNNRIVLATDGDFNVGLDTNDDLQRLVEKERESGIYISVLGYGMGNYRDDMAETIANKGNGNYAYIDNILEAKKVLVNEFGGTFYTVAKDVKLQIEFNPKYVKEYRLIGYENRMLNTEDFEDDKKDAGEVGAGHTVTALYEIVPAGGKNSGGLRYQSQELNEKAKSGKELAFLKIRYKKPMGNDTSILVEEPIDFNLLTLDKTDDNFRFSASVAAFGMLLRDSKYKGKTCWEQVVRLANGALGKDQAGYRREFVRLVESAELLAD